MTTFISPTIVWGNTNVSMTDAVFRSRCLSVHDALLMGGSGLVQTTDTGQMNFATVTVGGASSNTRGYTIYRFNDALQATSPIFIKVEWGVGATTGRMRALISMGTGSNGSGTLTGPVTGQVEICGQCAASADPGGNHYVCSAPGFFAMAVCAANAIQNGPIGYLSISRTRDPTSDALDSVGALLIGQDGNAGRTCNSATIRSINNPAASSVSRHTCIVPGTPGNTALLNGDKQLYPVFGAYPDVRQDWAQFVVRGSEIALNPTTFTATPFGTTARTFMFLGQDRAPICNTAVSTPFRLAFLWE